MRPVRYRSAIVIDGRSFRSRDRARRAASLWKWPLLETLRVAQTWLNSTPSFLDLERLQRKAIAGVIGETQKSGDDVYQDADLDREWGWFGSMRGMGDFANRIEENDRYLARAVDSIPQKGDVERHHYDRFAEQFVKAFRNSSRTGGVPTASRLLAMKRPDVFLCVSKPNLTEAARQMGFAKSTLDLGKLLGAGDRSAPGVGLVQCGQARGRGRSAVGVSRGNARRDPVST